MPLRIWFSSYLFLFAFWAQAQVSDLKTIFELSEGKQTPTYPRIIDWWKKLDALTPQVHMETRGMTDAGYPLHVVVVAADGKTDWASIRKSNKRIILINNGIHPGEPDGIDASMLLARDIVTRKIDLPNNVVLAIIPVYNIGGALNRSDNYRVDQNGPEAFGSRGNSQNLDLNRDFIKCDSKEALSFVRLFRDIDPDVFIDNHVSNGADYQHVMTLLTTQYDKLGGVMGDYLRTKMEPGIYARMKDKGYDLVPYVNSYGDKPEGGWALYWDGPRYSSGYAALWQCFSFVPETHMLKPYAERVMATVALMQSFIAYTAQHAGEIKSVRDQMRAAVKSSTELSLNWAVDKTRSDTFLFKGYQAGYKPSEVSGMDRLYYDRTKPFEKPVAIQTHYRADRAIIKPTFYVIPQGWHRVLERLEANGVAYRKLASDTTIECEVYQIIDYKSSAKPYEWHHLNTEVKLEAMRQVISFRKGDWLIPTGQIADRFLMEVLEPQAEDSYFSWNFFDPILGQKEGYSLYSFEDVAASYLKTDTVLQRKLAEKKVSDPAFAQSGRAQLDFIYRNSPWAEPGFMRYPVYRITR
ncbi:MAG: M14 family metallopeptidase [Bacteroidota bacterium]